MKHVPPTTRLPQLAFRLPAPLLRRLLRAARRRDLTRSQLLRLAVRRLLAELEADAARAPRTGRLPRSRPPCG